MRNSYRSHPMKRTHCCGELSAQHSEEAVKLIGWVNSIRDHGGLLFIDLRDRSGIVQLVIDPQNSDVHQKALQLRVESVIEIDGTVRLRPEETVNRKISTGEIEVIVSHLQIHNIADPLPFSLDSAQAEKVNEELRLTYRYLDLRREKFRHLLNCRHRIAQAVRGYLDGKDFWEIELPVLFKTTPEGAREFLVPSRINAGSFYALAQSPQQYKQMLMVGGVERYYSLAKCFRDEDLRADRQPEFTQIDLEMSFIDREDIYELMEGMFRAIWQRVFDRDLPTPFPRLTYAEAMNRFGSDKPDTRYGLELQDISSIFSDSAFKVFRSVVDAGGRIMAFKIPQIGAISQSEMRTLETEAKSLGAKGLAYIKVEEEGWKSPILKFLKEKEKAQIGERLSLQTNDWVFFSAAKWERAAIILGKIRTICAGLLKDRGLLEIPENQFNFLWIVDFPLLTFDEKENRYVATHHPFTAPVPEDIPLMDSAPETVRGQHYDLVLNGWEIGGGSIRIHSPELQRRIFHDLLQISEEVLESRFGYFLRAFHFGAPPHGGIAIGLDRLAALLGGADSIREVIAFPKTQRGMDLMANSPSPASETQLRDLHIGLLEGE